MRTDTTDSMASRHPSDAIVFAGIRATEHDLATFKRTGSPGDRERFLDGAKDLLYLACEWIEPYVKAGEDPPPFPGDMRDRFLRLNAERNAMIGYDPAKHRGRGR